MRKNTILLVIGMLPAFAFSQTASKAASEAYLITRMVQKFHFNPKPLNDSFSAQVYNGFLKQADPQKEFFTQSDIQSLSAFEYNLDEEIAGRKTGFLQLASGLYGQRLQQADSVINEVCKQSFNFNLAEKITVPERTDYAANLSDFRNKLYKSIKNAVLNYVVESSDSIASLSSAQLKKYVDSIEPIGRNRAKSMYSRSIKQALEAPGGIGKQVADMYCKAIAETYDPHTNYMPLTDKENFEAALGNKKPVFGFSMDENEKGEPVIDNLLPGSSAFKSGQFNKGDKIISVQWEGKAPIDVSDANRTEIYNIMEASNHDKLLFTIKKPDGTTRQVPLLKETSDQEDDDEKVKSFILKGDKTIGYISLPAFYEDWEDEEVRRNGCANDVAKEIVKLKKENIDGLIIDLRYNGGGSVTEASELTGIFIDGGPVVQFKTKEQKVITLKDGNRGTIYDGPLVVMVNGYSASASEMVAGTLQDYNRALIVGTPTYGKATAQAVFPMDTTIKIEDDFSKKTAASYIKITTAQLYRITGKTAQAIGVVPDVLLPDLLQADGKREANNPLAIQANIIDANKYYTPYKVLPVQSALAAGSKAVAANAYFNMVQKYVSGVKSQQKIKEVSLNLADRIRTLKENRFSEVPAPKEVEPSYIVKSHFLDSERMKTDKNMEELNEGWKALLAKDPYLQATYQVISSLTK